MSGGFVRLERSAFDSDLWTEERTLSRFEAWLDLRRLATWKRCRRIVEGIPVELYPGQLIVSERTLTRRWRWGRTKVRNLLFHLEETGRIRKTTHLPNHRTNQHTNHPGTLITIITATDSEDEGDAGEPPHEPPPEPAGEPFTNRDIDGSNNNTRARVRVRGQAATWDPAADEDPLTFCARLTEEHATRLENGNAAKMASEAEDILGGIDRTCRALKGGGEATDEQLAKVWPFVLAEHRRRGGPLRSRVIYAVRTQLEPFTGPVREERQAKPATEREHVRSQGTRAESPGRFREPAEGASHNGALVPVGELTKSKRERDREERERIEEENELVARWEDANEAAMADLKEEVTAEFQEEADAIEREAPRHRETMKRNLTRRVKARIRESALDKAHAWSGGGG